METKEIADKLIQDGYNADSLHGDLSQAQRDHVMNKFRQRNLQILVATDVAARGLDVNDLSHIINYNIPDELEAYIHRSGRTGRAGKHGISISIIHSRELNKISQLEKKVGKPFEKKSIPTGKDICEKQLFNLIDKVEWVEVDESRIESYLDMIYKKLAWLPREELIKRFVSVEFNRFLSYYKDAADLNVALTKKEKLREPRREPVKQSNPNYTRFHINAGTKDGLSVLNLIALINENTGNNSMEIGQIEILKKFSFFEVEKENEKVLLDAFQDVDYAGMKLKIEVTKNPSVDSEFPVRERESDEPDVERSDRSEGGFKSRGDYKSRDNYKSKDGYKPREGRTRDEKRTGDFAPRERRSDEGSREGYKPREGGYKSKDSFQSKDGYKPREGYKTRDEKRSDDYKPREGGFKSREGGSSREGYKPR